MIVGTWFVYNPPPAWPRVSRYPLVYCDFCGKKIEKRKVSLAPLWKKKLHFCGPQCRDFSNRKGGKLRNQQIEDLQAKYGSNITNTMQIPAVKAKYKETIQERYGSTSMMRTKHFIKEREKTWVEKYGVDHNFKIPYVQERSRKARLTSRNFPSSKSEDRFYEFLCSIFESENIERQVRVHIWPIDFYVKTIDAYIQFDGVYWHGLDRPLEEIAKLRTKHDQEIYVRYHSDREQDKWFKDRNLKLIRITDVEFDTIEFELLVERIKK